MAKQKQAKSFDDKYGDFSDDNVRRADEKQANEEGRQKKAADDSVSGYSSNRESSTDYGVSGAGRAADRGEETPGMDAGVESGSNVDQSTK